MINVKEDTASMLQEHFDIAPEITAALFEKGIIREVEMRKVLLREEYKSKVKRNGKQILRHDLAAKYCISVSLVEKIIFK